MQRFSTTAHESKLGISRGMLAFSIMALALGAALRLSYSTDMEYKGDEHYTFDRSQHIGVDEPWPDLGMVSSGGIRNPGMGNWVFHTLAIVWRAKSPVALARSVALTSILAAILLFFLTVNVVPRKEREAWLWAGALAAVNPLAMILQRKIWAPSILPIFCVVFLYGWLRRDTWRGAIAWGFIGPILGQIHMGAFFFSFGFFVWEAVLGTLRNRAQGRAPTQWFGWVAGSILGALPLVPWVRYVLSGVDHGEKWNGDEVLSGRFFLTWLSDGMGLGVDYSLGKHYWDFLRYPLIGDRDFYPALYMHGVSFSAGLVILIAALVAAFRWIRAGGTLSSAIARSSETAHTLGAAFFGYGFAITLAGLHIFRHYLHVTFPLEWLAFSYLAFTTKLHRPRVVLAVMWLAQLGLSATFLHYIHVNGGAVGADYGPAYSTQNHGRR